MTPPRSPEDSSNNSIDVTANDTDDDGDTLTVQSASAANGTATPSGGSISYTPDPDYNGADTITYVVSDGNGGTDSATVAVTVTPVNDAPVADDQTVSTEEDTAASITLGRERRRRRYSDVYDKSEPQARKRFGDGHGSCRMSLTRRMTTSVVSDTFTFTGRTTATTNSRHGDRDHQRIVGRRSAHRRR